MRKGKIKKVEMTSRRSVDGCDKNKSNGIKIATFFYVFRRQKKENCETDHEEQVVANIMPSPTSEAVEDEELISSSTMEKDAATKKYIENHYNKRMT